MATRVRVTLHLRRTGAAWVLQRRRQAPATAAATAPAVPVPVAWEACLQAQALLPALPLQATVLPANLHPLQESLHRRASSAQGAGAAEARVEGLAAAPALVEAEVGAVDCRLLLVPSTAPALEQERTLATAQCASSRRPVRTVSARSIKMAVQMAELHVWRLLPLQLLSARPLMLRQLAHRLQMPLLSARESLRKADRQPYHCLPSLQCRHTNSQSRLLPRRQ